MKNYKLTNKELEVLQNIANGMTTKEVAQNLFMSSETVKTHRSKLLQKLDARNACQLGVIAMRNNLIDRQVSLSF